MCYISTYFLATARAKYPTVSVILNLVAAILLRRLTPMVGSQVFVV